MTPVPETEVSEPPAPVRQERIDGAVSRCQRCSMRVLNDEMAIHLAHAHNIGPATGKKDKGNRDGNRRRR